MALAVLQSTGFIALARSGQLFPAATQRSDLYDHVIVHTCHHGHDHDGRHRRHHVARRAHHRPRRRQRHVRTDVHLDRGPLPDRAGHPAERRRVVFTLDLLLGLAIMVSVVFVEQAQRRIPVQYAKRMIGRRMYGGTSTYLPLKVNQAGVIPVIFASSLLTSRSCSASWTSNAATSDSRGSTTT